jgi:RES domain-containing protein
LTFNAKQQAAIKRWISRAAPLKGIFFRSIEYRYMDPVDVLSGAGTRAYGGRFAPTGTRAVYLSATDSGRAKRSQHASCDSAEWARSASTSILELCMRLLWI